MVMAFPNGGRIRKRRIGRRGGRRGAGIFSDIGNFVKRGAKKVISIAKPHAKKLWDANKGKIKDYAKKQWDDNKGQIIDYAKKQAKTQGVALLNKVKAKHPKLLGNAQALYHSATNAPVSSEMTHAASDQGAGIKRVDAAPKFSTRKHGRIVFPSQMTKDIKIGDQTKHGHYGAGVGGDNYLI